MAEIRSKLPSRRKLIAGMKAALSATDAWEGPITILDRQTSEFASTHPSEVVTCRIGDTDEEQLLIKYGIPNATENVGHRTGVAYEGRVYRHLLRSISLPSAFSYGTYVDEESGCTWLVLEYLAGSETLNRMPDFLPAAAGWLGRFHAALPASGLTTSQTFLKVYDAEYYVSWVRRAAAFATPLIDHFPWLDGLPEKSELLDPLLSVEPVVIHGEFYPKNILCYDGSIFPVDWESAAIATGTIDLVSLTDEWPEDIVLACIRAYQRNRWPDGAPADFGTVLEAARLYWHLRWLGNRSDWISRKGPRFRDLWRRLEYIDTQIKQRT